MISGPKTAGVGPALPRRRLLGVCLGGLILAACRPKAGPVRVRIGYQKSGVLLLAKARGGLEAALAGVGPVAVEWIEFVAGPPMLEAMRARAIDIGAVLFCHKDISPNKKEGSSELLTQICLLLPNL